jgi:hypothetical protein
LNKPVGMCPVCEEEKVNSYAVISRNGVEITCPRGHAFRDLNDFGQAITKDERKKMEKQMDKNASSLFGTRKLDDGMVPAMITTNPEDLSIDEVNKARLETLLGEFSDVSSLVGLVYSLNEEKKNMEDIIRNAKKAKVGEEDGKVLPSGDLQFSGVIPERHVQPLIDLSHSWNRNVTDYVNERLIELFDNMMFY